MKRGSNFEVDGDYGASVNVYELDVERNSNRASVWITLRFEAGTVSSSLTLDQAQKVRDAIDACIRAQRGEA